jgi:hypothetical protein
MSFQPGVSARAGVTLSESVSVDVQVTPQANDDLTCEMDYNGSKVRVIYRSSGDVDFDTYPFQE